MTMTLKELCYLFNKYSDDDIKCDNAKSEYLMLNKNNFHFEKLEESDIENLRPYLKCIILSMYEYLAIQDKVETQEWFNRYTKEHCPKEENDEYKALKLNPIAPENADSIFESMLSKAIEPFKSRGITADCFDYTV